MRPSTQTAFSATNLGVTRGDTPEEEEHADKPELLHEMSVSAAENEVLNTTELLETILSTGSPIDMFRQQRVSTYWKAVISHSPAMQTRMFLRDAKATLHSSLTGISRSSLVTYDQAIALNPLTKDFLPGSHQLPTRGPFMFLRNPHNIGIPETLYASSNIQFKLILKPRLLPPITNIELSWRATYITSPPVHAIDLTATFGGSSDRESNSATVWNENGLRWGDVMRIIAQLTQQDGVPRWFWLRFCHRCSET